MSTPRYPHVTAALPADLQPVFDRATRERDAKGPAPIVRRFSSKRITSALAETKARVAALRGAA